MSHVQPLDVFRSHAASLGLQAQILRQGCTRSYVTHVDDFEVACSVMRFNNSRVRQGCTRAYRLLHVGCSVLVFTSSSFKKRFHKCLCSATSGCYRSDVALRCLQIQVLRQGCTSAYVTSLKVVTGRM